MAYRATRCKTCSASMWWTRRDGRWVAVELDSFDVDDALLAWDDVDGQDIPGFNPSLGHVRHRCAGRRQEPAPNRVAKRSNEHAVLFLAPNAPTEVARAAYRALAALHHPDRGGDTRAMQEINAAYETIISKEKRGDTWRG